LTASPRRGRITGGQRARLTPTLAFAPSNALFQARRRGSRGGRTAPTPAAPAEVALVVPMRTFTVAAARRAV